jgi:hypothetical protein
MNTLTTEIRSDPVDELISLYCHWRTQCAAVAAAYSRVSSARPSDQALAFASYWAALDREESAAHAYASQVRLIMSREQEPAS